MTPMADAARLMKASRPRSPEVHSIVTSLGEHAFVSNGSRIYDLDEATAADLQRHLGAADGVEELLERLGLGRVVSMQPEVGWTPPVRALSLAVSQACNLACGYCYAKGGSFGAPATNMSGEIAEKAVRRLFDDVPVGDRVRLAFIGGEPLVNRPVIRRATQLASELAAARGIDLGFSITSNGTLLQADDAEFFERYGFAVTISIDGVGATHDRVRHFADGKGSFDRIMANIRPLLAVQRRMQVSARVSVTPVNMDIFETVSDLIGRGFHSVGVSPVLHSPAGTHDLDRGQLETLLQAMTRCGEEFIRQTIVGCRYPFENLSIALRELHRGTHRPYPCGAGAGYLGVSASGDLAACHRFVNDPAGAMGTLAGGIDRSLRTAWLEDRHVDRQEPCRSCWARYLCGGGCHHEVIHRGRPACDFIRGWLQYCIEAYIRLIDACPEYFEADG